VALTNGITLLSVNGPNTTAIVGGTQTRCVYVGSNSVLSGFTITNGAARNTGGDITNEQSGGGVWCQAGGVVSNCLISGNSSGLSYGHGGGIYGGTVWNSTLYRNSSQYGGGAASASLFNCLIVSNALMNGSYGGGVYQGTLSNCMIATNWAYYGGGGAHQSTLYHCTVTGNNSSFGGGGTYQGTNFNCLITGNTSSGDGGGAYQGTNFNCSITGNAAYYGGGTYQSTNYACFITGNTASSGGGGAYGGWLCNCVLNGNAATNNAASGGGLDTGWIINCTVTGNSASGSGGGMSGGDAFNSIIYFNSAPSGPNWANGADFGYCCTTPWVGWPDCITNDPAFVDAAGGDFRLRCGSPCIDAGISIFSPLVAPTNDIRGATRPVAGNPGFDMGAYEYDPAIDQIPVIRAALIATNYATGFPVPFVAEIAGCADYFWWDFGDGTTVHNQANASYAWSSPGTFSVILSAYYSSLGGALCATTQVQVVQQPVYYADLNSPSPASPFTNWTSAAEDIQQAIAAGSTPGRLVLVADGVYPGSGVIVFGSEYNALALTNAVIVQSVNGAGSTTIPGEGFRCAYVGSNAILSGFTLIGGRTLSSGDSLKEQSGGGVWCEPGGVVSNCVIAESSAHLDGGGAYQGTFYNCTFTKNTAVNGGGTYQATLYNCTFQPNSAANGGGACQGTFFNCTFTNNSAANGGGVCQGTLSNCVITGNNTAFGYGGGSCSNLLWNCTLSGNGAEYGGGASYSTLYNCVVAGNSASKSGGGAYACTFYNCTITGNTAPSGGGICGNGVNYAYNSIIYDNTVSAGGSVNNWQGGLIGYNTCSFPLLGSAAGGNITNDPMFMDCGFHLSAASPCRGTGSSLYATGTDMDGEAWQNPPSMGADEVYDADFIGALSVAIQASQTSLLVNRSLALTGLIAGRASGLQWSFGDGTIVSNVDYFTSHVWTNAGDYPVVFTAYNTDNPGGVSANLLVQVLSLAPPSLQPGSFSVSSTNGFQFQFSGQSNAVYTVQVTTNLAPPVVWQNLQTITGTGGVVQVTDANATNGTGFYRVGVQ
jgi:hypothetical protein